LNCDFEKTLDIIAKFIAIISTALLLYFRIFDKRITCKVKIIFTEEGLPIISDGAGGLLDWLVPVISIQIVNQSKIEIFLSKITLYIDEIESSVSLRKSWRYVNNEDVVYSFKEPFGPFRKVSSCFSGADIFNNLPIEIQNMKKITIRAVVRDEYGHKFKSNRLKINTQNLRFYE
jgi:hypothetical protein